MEKEEILISWLSEYDYCPRRFWLKAVERIEGENEYTAEGSIAHQYVDANRIEKRKEKIKVTGLGVRSARYNLYCTWKSDKFISRFGIYCQGCK